MDAVSLAAYTWHFVAGGAILLVALVWGFVWFLRQNSKDRADLEQTLTRVSRDDEP